MACSIDMRNFRILHQEQLVVRLVKPSATTSNWQVSWRESLQPSLYVIDCTSITMFVLVKTGVDMST